MGSYFYFNLFAAFWTMTGVSSVLFINIDSAVNIATLEHDTNILFFL